MICPSCNKENQENRKFCTFCGAELPKVKYCPNCGRLVDASKKFCEGCGTPNNFYSESESSYPVFSQLESTQSPDQMLVRPNNITSDRTATVNMEQAPFSQPIAPQISDSEPSQHIESAVINVQSELNSPTHNVKTVDSNNLEGRATANEKDQITTDEEQTSQAEDQPLSDESNSDDIPDSNDLKKGGSAGRWVLGILIFFVLVGGALVLGQHLNWWNIELLSWVGADESQDTLEVASSTLDTVTVSEEVIAVETNDVVEDEIDVSEPYTVHLNGTIGGKYPIEVILDGERKGDGFYPASGKYRYTKYGDSWLKLHGTTESVDNTVSYLKLLEYSDGNLTGSWEVRYDMSNNTLRGYMSDSKGEAYSVSAGRGYESSSYNEAEVDSVAY